MARRKRDRTCSDTHAHARKPDVPEAADDPRQMPLPRHYARLPTFEEEQLGCVLHQALDYVLNSKPE